MVPRFMSDAELSKFIEVVRGRKHHALIVVLANLGIRPSEALAITRADVHLDEAPQWVRVCRLKKRKSIAECDDLEVSTDLAAVLKAHMDTMGDRQRLFVVNRRSLQRSFKLYARAAGMPRSRKLYDLRHTAATRIYVATRDIKMAQALLGHEKPDTTTIYAHIPRRLLVETSRTVPTVV